MDMLGGALSAFQPQKGLFRQRKGHGTKHKQLRFSMSTDGARRITLLGLAFASLAVSFTIAFTISWLTPTVGLGGRGLAEIIYVVVWVANFLANETLTGCVQDTRRLFNIIWAKDSIIALLVISFFLLPFIGELCQHPALTYLTFCRVV